MSKGVQPVDGVAGAVDQSWFASGDVSVQLSPLVLATVINANCLSQFRLSRLFKWCVKLVCVLVECAVREFY